VTGLTSAALEALNGYPFPGNVRELENEIERAVALASPGEPIDVHLLSHRITVRPNEADLIQASGRLRKRLHEFERRLLSAELVRHGHNRTRTARTLGISVRALQKKILQLGITD